MRIVAGRHRGRRLVALRGTLVRPTSDRAREAVFNRLVHGGYGEGGASVLAGARVLDAFAGTGANGLEALSRGALHATLIERDGRARAAIRANVARLGEEERVTLLAADATRPPRAPAPSTLAFLDAPYESGLTGEALRALAAAGWFARGTLVVVEIASAEDLAPPPGFAVLDARTYGAAKVLFLRREKEG